MYLVSSFSQLLVFCFWQYGVVSHHLMNTNNLFLCNKMQVAELIRHGYNFDEIVERTNLDKNQVTLLVTIEINRLASIFLKNIQNKKLMKLIGSKTDQLEYALSQIFFFKSFGHLTPQHQESLYTPTILNNLI